MATYQPITKNNKLTVKIGINKETNNYSSAEMKIILLSKFSQNNIGQKA